MNKFWEVVQIAKGEILPYKKDLKYKQAIKLMAQLNAKPDMNVYMMRRKCSASTF